MLTDKVIWKDGLFVLPQHFQQFERYLLDIIRRTGDAAIPYIYGFSSCTIDLNLLAEGKLSLTEAKGIMPDGTPFAMPQPNAVPKTCTLDKYFSPQKTKLDVYLALALPQADTPISSEPGDPSDTRYKSEMNPVADEVSGKMHEEIEIGRCNFLLRFEGESFQGLSSLRIARLKQTVNEGISIDETVSPTIISIAASQIYLKKFGALLSELRVKGEELLRGRKQLAHTFSISTPEEVANHFLLASITTHTPLLNHFYEQASQVHPYTIYKQIGQLAGALQTFGTGDKISDLPAYDHLNPLHSFDEMHASIHEVLKADYSSRCIRIPINKNAESSYICTITDPSLLTQGEFFLGLCADASHEILIDAARRAIKMTSDDQLQRLTIGALPGLRLNPVMNPPADLATKKDFVYFSLSREGDHWRNIQEKGTIAFYFPNTLSNLTMELLAVKTR